MTLPRITEWTVLERLTVHSPPDPRGKAIAPGNTVWDLTSVDEAPGQSLAIWLCDQPMPPHRCQSDMWYRCVSGKGQVFVEGVNGLQDMAAFEFGVNGAVMIPATRWCFSIPERSFIARIMNQPAFEPHHFIEMDQAHSLDFEVFEYFNSACSQLGWPFLADAP